MMPAASLLPVVANWFAPAVRGLLAMAPPPPPLPPVGPCPGISGAAGTKASCAPCPTDLTKLCAFFDANGNNVKDPGEVGPGDIPPPGNPFFTLPANLRGFDDPQADPDPTYTALSPATFVKYQRADLYALPYADGSHAYDTNNNGNPPWGSCMTVTARGCPAGTVPDGDADQLPDSVPDRHNKGMYAAMYDKQPVVSRPDQQYPLDAIAGKSCPLDLSSCDPSVPGNDCGGFAHFADFSSNNGTPYAGAAPKALLPSPYQTDEPLAKDKWPVVPFARNWAPYDAGLSSDYPSPGPSSSEAIRRLLRFVSSIVTYNSGAPVTSAYSLAEYSTEVVATAPTTPLAGALEDAYEYFEQSVFKPVGIQDPAIDCRNYIIVYITDGKDECNSEPCAGGRSGLPYPNGGVAKDLADLALPESAPGARAAAHLADPTVREKGIPVKMVAMANDTSPFYGNITCIAGADPEGEVFLASNRDQLEAALETILNFKRNANSFVAPAVPAFGSASGSDTAMIGAVIPSHSNPGGVLSSWSIWSGSLKAFKLDSAGLVPFVTGTPLPPPATVTPGGPTPVPATPTPTPAKGTGNFPDESDPDDAIASQRKPVWNAARVLGYTDPTANLGGAAVASAGGAGSGVIKVWPGRRMVFSRDGSPGDVPMTRADFMPNSGTCAGGSGAGTCFRDLMTFMGYTTFSAADVKNAQFTVQFLRGGQTKNGSGFGKGRDEILNQVKPVTIPTIGPTTNPQFSYYYQDDIPAPGTAPPQNGNPTDGGASPAGYPHKLGDIFHSESLVIEPPRYFQYLSANLTPPGTSTPQPYLDFSQRNAKRRRVVYVGSNDGFLHAFDAGVFNGDPGIPGGFDLGSGREIFAYTPRPSFGGGKFQSLLEFSPQPQYFVDGSMGHADVFIDPEFDGSTGPDPLQRVWRTVLVGGLRQGGSGYYALDVTQPDDIDDVVTNPTYGEMVGTKSNSPNCLDGAGGSCDAGATSNRPYPSILWEFTDGSPAAPCSDASNGACSLLASPSLGETWSRPVLGRIKVITSTVPPVTYEDRYVAIFGGGFDPGLDVADDPIDSTVGRAFYMVDIETGKILFKTSEGVDAGGSPISFGPMPAAPAVADYNDDGYLDVVYIGDTRGNMWRIDITPDASATPEPRGELQADSQLHGYQPFQLFDTCRDVSGAFQKSPPKTGKNCVQPIFYEPGIVYLGGASSPPALGIAFGTGDRSSLTRLNPTQTVPPNPAISELNSFYYVIDGGSTATTMGRTDLIDITPPATPCVPYDPAICGLTGFVLDFETANEKATSTVFSTLGELSIVTFTPDSLSPCATDGSSFRYRFFYLTGQPGYTTTSDYGGYREVLDDKGYAAAGQSVAPNGDIIDTVLFSGGGIRQDVTGATLQTIEQNWKEQQQ
jgi:hypothetical protein